MSLTFKSLSKRPILFNRLTGLSVNEFITISKVVEPIYNKERLKRIKNNTGRISNLKHLMINYYV